MLISDLLNEIQPKSIIELGCRKGGLTTFLGLWARKNKANVLAFDFEERSSSDKFVSSVPEDKELVEFLPIDFYRQDVLSKESENLISQTIQTNSPSIILCDAQKIPEFNLYAQYMKSGDIIMCHDYARNKEDFQTIQRYGIWFCNEIVYSDIEESCNKFNLLPYKEEQFNITGWGIFQKHD